MSRLNLDLCLASASPTHTACLVRPFVFGLTQTSGEYPHRIYFQLTLSIFLFLSSRKTFLLWWEEEIERGGSHEQRRGDLARRLVGSY